MRVECVNRSGVRVPVAAIRRRITAIIPALGKWRSLPSEISIVFVAPRESRRLNLRFRNRSAPANVLSFHYGTVGEIVIAPAVIRVQAKALGRSYGEELLRMALHGVVHLSGLDHEVSPTAERAFDRRERQLVSRVNRR